MKKELRGLPGELVVRVQADVRIPRCVGWVDVEGQIYDGVRLFAKDGARRRSGPQLFALPPEDEAGPVEAIALSRAACSIARSVSIASVPSLAAPALSALSDVSVALDDLRDIKKRELRSAIEAWAREYESIHVSWWTRQGVAWPKSEGSRLYLRTLAAEVERLYKRSRSSGPRPEARSPRTSS